jgi:hypothetical protein
VTFCIEKSCQPPWEGPAPRGNSDPPDSSMIQPKKTKPRGVRNSEGTAKGAMPLRTNHQVMQDRGG